MLDELTPEQLDEWIAYYRIEPFGEPWRQAALIAAEAHNAGVTAIAPHLGRKIRPTDMAQPDDYLRPQRTGSMDPRAFEALAKVAYAQHR